MKLLFIALGFIFMGIGFIGVVVPVLPTTPLLLLASFFFAKGSDRFYKWFSETKLYKNHLEEFAVNRAMTIRTKVYLLSLASLMLAIPLFTVNIMAVRLFIIGLVVFKYYYFIFRIKTI